MTSDMRRVPLRGVVPELPPHFSGFRDREENITVFGPDDRPLPWRLDLWNHSPTGFNWGYGGSGPAQLALAILAAATNDDELAVRMHQDFKFAVIAGITHESWILPVDTVLSWIAVRPCGEVTGFPEKGGEGEN